MEALYHPNFTNGQGEPPHMVSLSLPWEQKAHKPQWKSWLHSKYPRENLKSTPKTHLKNLCLSLNLTTYFDPPLKLKIWGPPLLVGAVILMSRPNKT